jgi:hypothetical protein
MEASARTQGEKEWDKMMLFIFKMLIGSLFFAMV